MFHKALNSPCELYLVKINTCMYLRRNIKHTKKQHLEILNKQIDKQIDPPTQTNLH